MQDTKVVIQGDASLRFGDVRHAMVAVEDAGFKDVGLIAQRAKTREN
jgi:biopolymer transport protein ExbD